jgi:WD40 repeat protein
MPNGEAQRNPPGWTLLHTLTGHTELIKPIRWTPDGQRIITGSADQSIKIWDASSGREINSIRLSAYCFDLVLVPDSQQVIAAVGNHLEVWDISSGVQLKSLVGHADTVWGMAVTPDGKTIVSASADNTFYAWDFSSGNVIAHWKPDGSANKQPAVEITHDGRFAIFAQGSGAIQVREISSGTLVKSLDGHNDNLSKAMLAPDGGKVVSGSDDGRIYIWDLPTGLLERVLEGHTDWVVGVSFSHDGRFLVSKDATRTIRLWNCEDWQLLTVLEETQNSYYIPSVPLFHPSRNDVVATYGENGCALRLWQLDYDVILPRAASTPTINYTTAKLALVGDSGVGKSGLGWRLAEGKFRETFSTHGQQFWVMRELAATREDGTQCEAVLWDFAGQSYYRLVHALFLDDVDLALLLFDPTDVREPLEGVEYWLRQLPGEGRRPQTILVGARADRGVPNLSGAEIEAFCKERGITGGYVSTSAYTGEGVGQLVELIKRLIDWDAMTATVTTDTFKRTKDFVLKLKESQGPRVLVTKEELRERLQATDAGWRFTDDEMTTALRHLETHGYVKMLRGSAESHAVLLAPDLLINLASSIVLQAGRNQEDLGALDEAEVQRGGYGFPELARLEADERVTLLDAAASLFLNRNLCFRETLGRSTYLVFPALIKQKRPKAGAAEMKDDVAYRITGAVENVYAALVVLLGYTNTFTRTNHWHRQAQYETEGHVCGFRQTEEGAGEIELVLYYAPATPPHVRQLFQALFEGFLARRKVSVQKYPPLVCANCGELQPRDVVTKRLAQRKTFLRCAECGEEINLSQPGGQPEFPARHQAVVNEEKALTDRRTKFEAEMVYVKRLVDERRRRAPSCFVSYAWGDAAHARWVERLATDLKNLGVLVILDQWENMAIGSSLARFVDDASESDFVLVVGTPEYLRKRNNLRADDPRQGYVVSAEADLIEQRLVSGSEEVKATVLPLLVQGKVETSLPPFLRGRIFADFREEKYYFVSLFELVLTLYGLSNDAAVRDLRQQMREEADR